MVKIWFQDSITIDCTVEDVNKSLNNIGEHYKKIISMYPGMSIVELLEKSKNSLTIKTNEGTMKRTNISVQKMGDKTKVEFDEEYITSKITTTSHFVESFEMNNGNTELHIEISNLTAPGILGFLLRNFGNKNIGNGFLSSYAKVFNK